MRGQQVTRDREATIEGSTDGQERLVPVVVDYERTTSYKGPRGNNIHPCWHETWIERYRCKRVLEMNERVERLLAPYCDVLMDLEVDIYK